MNQELNIIGSGLTGPLLATLLAKKHNCNINMYERSFDSRISAMHAWPTFPVAPVTRIRIGLENTSR